MPKRKATGAFILRASSIPKATLVGPDLPPWFHRNMVVVGLTPLGRKT